MQSHYNYSYDNITSTYNFTTKNGILYRVAFVVDYTFSTISGQEIEHIYQLVIEKAVDILEPFDAGVSKTVDHIISSFFINSENFLIYICSESEDKAELRHRVFNRWYDNSSYNATVLKLDNIIEYNLSNNKRVKLYTSLLYHVGNPSVDKLIAIYNTIELVLNQDK